MRKTLLIAALSISILCLMLIAFPWFLAIVDRDPHSIPNFGNRAELFAMLQERTSGASPLRFVVMGDIQQGIAEFNALQNVVNDRKGIDFIVQCGDIVTEGDEAHYRFVMGELDESTGVSVPMFAVPGNHDTRPDSAMFEKYIGARTFCFEFKKCLFIGMDDALGFIDKKQFAWVEDVLSTRRRYVDQAFVFMHKAPVPGASGGDPQDYVQVKDAPRFLGLLDKYRVDYVFAGHSRNFYRTQQGNTHFVVNGRGGARHTAWPSAPSFMVIVEVSAGNIAEETEAVDSRIDICDFIEGYSMVHACPKMKSHPLITAGIVLAAAAMAAFSARLLLRGRRSAIGGGAKA
jgi:Icc-related predicted phosphoesterase